MPLIRPYCQKDHVFVFDSHLDSQFSSYAAHHLDHLMEAEKSHFWFTSRCEIICRTFQQHIDKTARILEIGGGTGFIAKNLTNLGYRVEMADIHSNGLRYAQKKGIDQLYQFDLFNPPFHEEFDVICLFDVLEHLKDDMKALECLKVMLKPGGFIILTVPAHQWLWSRDDAIAGHYRRYTKKKLEELFETCCLELLYTQYFFSILVPFFLLRRFIKKDSGLPIQENETVSLDIHPIFNKTFSLLTKIEFYFNFRLNRFLGGSLIGVVQKHPHLE